MAKVLPDIRAVEKVFDYLVPEGLGDQVRVGTLVRIPLHGRRVRGWVLSVDDVAAEDVGRNLKPIAKVTGWGPPPELVDLTAWAAWRWAGPRVALLQTASPPNAVTGLPPRPAPKPAASGPVDELASAALDAPGGRAVLRLPPAADLFGVVAAAAARGPALVLSPSVDDAAHLALRLRRQGHDVTVAPREWARAAAGGCTVIGARAAAWAPVPDLAAVVVLDAHDEAYAEERTPAWHARAVAVERAERAGVPCVLVSPCPTVDLDGFGPTLAPSRTDERAGWPLVDVVDRTRDDPRTGLFSERLVRTLRAAVEGERGRAVCVLNRKGRARLLACHACGTLARCAVCDAAVEQIDEGLRCRRCGTERPRLCLACGSQRFRNLRAGVTRVREELEALVGAPVGEVTADSDGDGVPDTPVLVGTEAVLHRVASPVAAVAFLELDQELLAPRYRAAEEAFGLLARAARLLGGRAEGGRLLLQTRLPRHEVVQAALHADPERVTAAERERRAALGFPPFRALALVSGPSAAAFVADVRGVDVLGPDDGRWLLRAPDHRTLCDALAATPRPGGRLRIEVDPLRA